MASNAEHVKEMLQQAYHQEAVDMAIRDGKNYYFLPENEAKIYLDRAKVEIGTYLAIQGIV